ncbi:MAG: ImmA/IrrE family metallo-endopeptidase [Chloroflexota bacterium]
MKPNSAEKQAVYILEQYAIRGVPVDVVSLVQQMGLNVAAQELEDKVSGFLIIKNGQAAIGVNQNHHPNRQRFTVAHELGHYVLHRTLSNIFVDSTLTFYRDTNSTDGKTLQEIQANAFAAELLMPETIIRDYLRTYEIDLYDARDVANLASKFGVSEQALTIRLVNLNLISL